jgi:hypothetical protein
MKHDVTIELKVLICKRRATSRGICGVQRAEGGGLEPQDAQGESGPYPVSCTKRHSASRWGQRGRTMGHITTLRKTGMGEKCLVEESLVREIKGCESRRGQ